jgi:hypothetical protein
MTGLPWQRSAAGRRNRAEAGAETSEQRLPMASDGPRGDLFAARLKEVMRHCLSTVKTPSEMLSKWPRWAWAG